MIWLIILGALILLGIMPVGIIANYNDAGAGLMLSVGPIHFKLYPGKIKGKKSKRKQKSDKSNSLDSSDKRTKGSLSDFLSIAQFVLEVLSDFRRKIRVADLQLKLILAGDDPCDLSVNYARAWAAVGALMPQVERLFIIKNRNVEVQCDYLDDTTRIRARIHITITVARLLSVVLYHGIRGLRKYYRIIKQIKGGATI